jgi:hypothetical protein
MRLTPAIVAVLVGSAGFLLPAAALDATSPSDAIPVPDDPERCFFVPEADRTPPLEITGARTGRGTAPVRIDAHRLGRESADRGSNPFSALSLTAVQGNRRPTSFDSYLNQLENRIRRARRALDD